MIEVLLAGTATALATGLGAIPVILMGTRAATLRPLLLGIAAGVMIVASVLGLIAPAAKKYDKARVDEVLAMFPRLRERWRQPATTMSGGEQQMLAIARALVLNPRLLLLDEPTEGLAPIIVEELTATLRRIVREERLSAIIVEQHAKLILPITDDAIILDRGAVVWSGTSTALEADPAILEQHLGVGARAH
mgnify:CR=1 FL=1